MPHPPIEPEGPQSEWKVRLPKPDRTARTLCAFSNGAGGSLWVGVRDDGSLAGVHDVLKVTRELQAASAYVDPEPHFEVHTAQEMGLTLVHVRVLAGSHAVYRVLSGSHGPTVYLREGSSNRPADRQATKALQNPSKVRLNPKQRQLLVLLNGQPPQTVKELATQLRMGERNSRRLLIPLLRGGLAHSREGKRYALTALGVAQLERSQGKDPL